MNLYSYDGPVLEFERIIANNWKSDTWATSERKARANLAYRFKMETGRSPRSRISIPGKLYLVGKDENNGGSKRNVLRQTAR